MRLELLAAGLLAVACCLAAPVLGRRDGVSLILAVGLGCVLALVELGVCASTGLAEHPSILPALFSGGTRALTTALVHCAVGRAFLLPFSPEVPAEPHIAGTRLLPAAFVRTLNGRPLAAAVCLAFVAGGVHLILNFVGGRASGVEASDYARLGAVYVATAPLLAALSLAGGCVAQPDFITLALTTPILLIANFLGRNAALIEWSRASFVKQLPGLPLECIARDVLGALAVTLLLHVVAHAHVLLLLSPSLPPAPPSNVAEHLALLGRVVVAPPEIDARVLAALVSAPLFPRHLRLASLAAPRELRIALLTVHDWYASTSALALRGVSEACRPEDVAGILAARNRALAAIKLHLVQCYDSTPALERALTLCTVPLEAWQQAPFYLFASLIPRLAPIYPFLEIGQGLGVDAAFLPVSALVDCDDLEHHLPIATHAHLEAYASSIGGALATAACYLSWSVLEPSPTPLVPARSYVWAQSVHPDALPNGERAPGLAPGTPVRTLLRAHTILSARIMGRGMHLVSLAAGASKACTKGKVYLPLCVFNAPCELIDLLYGSGVPLQILDPILRMAERAREDAENSIDGLPKSARAAVNAAVAAAYAPACCFWEEEGETGKTCTCNVNRAVVQANWR